MNNDLSRLDFTYSVISVSNVTLDGSGYLSLKSLIMFKRMTLFPTLANVNISSYSVPVVTVHGVLNNYFLSGPPNVKIINADVCCWYLKK